MNALRRCINASAMPINRCFLVRPTQFRLTLLPTSCFQLHTSYFVTPCIAWWRRSTTQQAAALRRLYNFILPTSYFILRNTMHCMVETQYDAAGCGSTASLQFHTSCFQLHASYFVSPCVAWWRRCKPQQAASLRRLYNFILHASNFMLPTSYHHALHGGDAVSRSKLRLYGVSTISYFMLPTSCFLLRITMRCMVETL
jgi:hypothetical protein